MSLILLPVWNLPSPPCSATTISYKTGIFPLSDDVFGIYLMFCVHFSFDLVTLTFDLSILSVSEELIAWYVQRTYQFLASYDYPFLSYVWLNLITLVYHHLERGHCACAVSRDLSPGGGQKWSTFLKFLTPIYLFTTLSLSGSYVQPCKRAWGHVPLCPWRQRQCLRITLLWFFFRF